MFNDADQYARSLPALKTNYGFDLDMHLRLFIGQLVSADIVEKEFKKSIKRLEANNIVFGKNKREMSYTWFSGTGDKKI